MISDLDIKIRYLKKDMVWNALNIKPEDYFDMDYCELNEIDIDSVPKYDHAIYYIDKDVRLFVIATELKVYNKVNDISRNIITSYWHNQTQMFIERIDLCNDKITYHELIINLEIKDTTSTKCSIVRILRENDSAISKPLYHGIFTKLRDGSDVEQKLDVWQ